MSNAYGLQDMAIDHIEFYGSGIETSPWLLRLRIRRSGREKADSE